MVFANIPTRILHSTPFTLTSVRLPPQGAGPWGRGLALLDGKRNLPKIHFQQSIKILIYQFIEEFNRVKVRERKDHVY
jgi:hypothetical protein